MKTASAPFELRLLGGFQLRRGRDGERIVLRSKKARGLLSIVALAPRPPVSREKLAALLWSESGEAQARASLRQALTTARKVLTDGGRSALVATSEGVDFDAALIDVDVVELQACVGRADSDALARAAVLSAGPLLDGLETLSDDFDAWLTVERARVGALMTGALGKCFEDAQRRKDMDAAREIGQRLLALSPVREDIHRALMRIARDAGQWNEALAQFEACESLLRDELGVAPQGETLALRDEIHHLRNAERRYPVAEVLPDEVPLARSRLPFVPTPEAGKPSIVVLPFDTLTDRKEDEVLSDGVTEDIITELSRFKELAVIARSSAFAYKGRALTAQEVGRELSVQYIVTGAVRRSGTRVRLSVQLVAAADGKHIWAHRYDRELQDVLDLQDELACEIVAVLPGRVQDFEARRIARRPPEDMAAYELLLAGKIHHHRFTEADNRRALALLDRATSLAPDYAAAWAWKGCLYGQALARGYMPNPKRLLETSVVCVHRALELDPNEVECHRILAELAVMQDRDLTAALRHNTRALELNPNDPRLWAQRGELMRWLGRSEEAVGHVQAAMRLDPYGAAVWSHHLGAACTLLGRYAEAIEAYRASSYPRLAHRADLAACLAKLGDAEGAAREARLVLEERADFSARAHVQALPYAEESTRAHHLALLEAAGLPA